MDFFGADHHGYIPRLKASMTALGNDETKLNVDIIQMVRLVSNGVEMKMSKREGNATTINELCDSVGVDAARYFFVQRALDSHLDFDIELAKKQSNENPVYYAQYAHARMCSIQKQAQDIELASSYDLLVDEKEIELMKTLQEFKKVIIDSAKTRQVHKVCHYIQNLASKFHSVLKEQKQPMSFINLWTEVSKQMGYNESQFEDNIAQFYTDLSIDGRFFNMPQNTWDLKSRHTLSESTMDTDSLSIEDEDDEVEELEENE